MLYQLAEFLKNERLRKEVPLTELAKGLGYSNLPKGVRRIEEFEKTGVPAQHDLPDRLAVLLGVEPLRAEHLYWQDYERSQAWLNEPVPIRMAIRYGVCAYGEKLFPPGTTVEHALAEAMAYAKEHRRMVSLMPSRRLTVCIDGLGKTYKRIESAFGADSKVGVQVGNRQFQIKCLSNDE